MKLFLIMGLSFLFFTACQTSSVTPAKDFETFSFRKLKEFSIQEVTVTASDQAWPVFSNVDREGLAVNSQSLSFAVIGSTSHKNEVWPYPELVKKISDEKVDFIVHTGDYISDSNVWSAWWTQFYKPSLDLFKRFPFILLRGHHEREISSEDWIEIGDLIFIHFDFAEFETRAEALKKLQALVARIAAVKKKEVWFLSHQPVIGYKPNSEDAEPEAIPALLKDLLKESGLLTKIDYILSGHIKNQQIVLTEPNLKQFIVGTTGEALEPFGRQIKSQSLVSSTESKKNFGYAVFQRQGLRKWDVTFKGTEAQALLKCQLRLQKLTCD